MKYLQYAPYIGFTITISGILYKGRQYGLPKICLFSRPYCPRCR